MTISVAGAVANFALNYAMIHQWLGLPNLGLMGIGLVTAVVTNCMALALAWHIKRHPAYAAYPISKGLSKLSRSHLKELWRLGLPIGGTYAVEVGLFTFAAFCMGAMGSTQMAAHQIALPDGVDGVHDSGGYFLCGDRCGSVSTTALAICSWRAPPDV